MKLRKTLAGILGAVVMLLGVGTFEHINEHKEVWAATSVTATVEISSYAKSHNWVNESKYDSVVIDENITITSTSGTNSTKYYTSNTSWRIYQNESPKITLTASNDCILTSVIFTYSNKNSGTVTYNSKNYSSNSIIDLGGVTSSTFGVSSTKSGTKNGNIQITKIVVKYTSNQAPTHDCVFDQEVVDQKHWKSDPTCLEPAYYYLSCKECGKNGTEVFSYGEPAGHQTDELGFCSVCKKYDDNLSNGERVQKLANKYYKLDDLEEGKYNRHTLININDDTIEEATAYFHAKVNMLERTTYFTKDALWMTNEVGTYSYYGTKGDDLTGGRVPNVGDTVESIAQKNTGGMEGKYTTLNDIRDYAAKAEWSYDSTTKTYTTNDKTVVKQFLDFTAPCFLNFTDTDSNYIILDHVTVKEDGNKLLLKLHVDPTEKSKLRVVDEEKEEYILSTATISKYAVQQDGRLPEPVTITFDDKLKRTEYTTTVQVWEENGIVVTNNKASSQTNIGDFADPARFYKSSTIEINCNAGEFTTVTLKSEVDDSKNSYFTYLVNSLANVSGAVVENNGIDTVTITFDQPQNSFTFTASVGQVRLYSITCA